MTPPVFGAVLAGAFAVVVALGAQGLPVALAMVATVLLAAPLTSAYVNALRVLEEVVLFDGAAPSDQPG
ncbi:hypothetical protein NYO98_09720 [Nocardioides sp. STR2]|uniref:Uncharacterized protein n=1 Tax=Nocardioides pini TaxID=2975053 RepID=A0ABT4CC70_9ACTN|nr:hypothetical protein [Nocardioides pini]MCY4726553.1 hypothetical protein [Nocardioides pini]